MLDVRRPVSALSVARDTRLTSAVGMFGIHGVPQTVSSHLSKPPQPRTRVARHILAGGGLLGTVDGPAPVCVLRSATRCSC
jgi:hypothetical protein